MAKRNKKPAAKVKGEGPKANVPGFLFSFVVDSTKEKIRGGKRKKLTSLIRGRLKFLAKKVLILEGVYNKRHRKGGLGVAIISEFFCLRVR